MSDLPPATPPAFVRSLQDCGLKREGLTSKYDDVLQSDVVIVARAARATSAMFACIRKASWAKFDVQFDDPALAQGYRAYNDEQGRSWAKAQATGWLRSHNRLVGLPAYSRGDDPSKFAAMIEKFCGYEAGEAIELIAPSTFTMKPGAMKFPVDPRFECLVNAMIASDLEDHAIKLGFIGNEALEETNK